MYVSVFYMIFLSLVCLTVMYSSRNLNLLCNNLINGIFVPICIVYGGTPIIWFYIKPETGNPNLT